jgi:hypothetical protein
MRAVLAIRVRPAVLAALLTALAALACMKKDPDFCCSTQESCSRNGGPGVLAPCTDPDRPFCDDDGQYGIGRTCIADPVSNPCETPAECTNPDRPACFERRCVQCGDSPDCAVTTPVCDGATHLCMGCAIDDDCAPRAGTPRCLVASGACVACLDAGDCTVATSPVCDTGTHECRACRADGECASGFCDETAGSCVAEADIAYVSTTGGGTLCTRAMPCATITNGVAATNAARKYVLVAPGAYSETVSIDGRTVMISAAGAALQPSSLNQPGLVVLNGSDVTVEGLRVHDAGGGANAVGIRCAVVTSGMPRLSLSAVRVENNSAGGVRLDSCAFSIVNAMIVGNGSATSVFGGVEIGNVTAAGEYRLAFSTIANNNSSDAFAAGVSCPTVAVPLAFSSNIIFDNESPMQVSGSNCAHAYSDIKEVVVGTGNINQPPLFVDALNGNFHLMPTSPAKNAADPAATLTTDADGDARPQGGRSDMGADEVLE